ncbi:hypothetical protein ACPPVU_09725 [Mucilaginibacter sp. McL0603]|uniref:hypothetical protein n=1 Tax=Mucilaginibacter sp. McL0603 TaxID=3415670 RepID=UPI003CF3095F
MTTFSATQSTAGAIANDVAKTRAGSRKARYFFVGMAILFPVIAVIGFTPSYQAMNAGTLTPHWVVHIHGALMTSWLLVFLAQAILAANGNFKFHRKLGLLSVVLGVLVWLAMATVSAHALIANHPPKEDFLFDLLLMEFYAMSSFGLFFTWGIFVRKKDSAAHKRLLMLATLVLLQAAVDRIHWLPLLGIGYPYVFFLYLDTLLIPLFIYDFFSLRRIHKITLIGSGVIIMLQLSVSLIWGSPAWHQFWFNRLAPFVEKVIEVKLNDAQTDPLLGNYGDKKWHMTVSDDKGKLYLKLPDQPAFELGAISKTELFVTTILWKLYFVKGADGRVIKVINKQGPLTWEVQRLKN